MLDERQSELVETRRWDFKHHQRSLWDAGCRWDFPNPEHR
jgi:hypothetical protein